MKNMIFISPTFPRSYIQFAQCFKNENGNALCIGEDGYDTFPQEVKQAMTEYYQVTTLHDYDQVYKAVAWFAHRYGKIDCLESFNEYWLYQDALLRQDFHITHGNQPTTIMPFKEKSKMKHFFHLSKIPTARFVPLTTYQNALSFIQDVGYPIIAKPDQGVGANQTWKIQNEQQLQQLFHRILDVPYILEEFIPGHIESFDGYVDHHGTIVYQTTHIFPRPILNIVQHKEECIYYNHKSIPLILQQYGHKLIQNYQLTSSFFHLEFIQLNQDKPGLGKKGDYIGLEVNMRPPGGYTTDMMNYASDINIYQFPTLDLLHLAFPKQQPTKYVVVHIGRRDHFQYEHNAAEIFNQYPTNILMHDRIPHVLSSALGNEFYIARFKNQEDCQQFIHTVLKKKEVL